MVENTGFRVKRILTVEQECAPAKYRGLTIAAFQTWTSLGMPRNLLHTTSWLTDT